eukprot:g3186.t1
MYSPHGAQDNFRSSSALIDVTNSTLHSSELPDETFNGHKGYTTSCGDGRQQQRYQQQQHSPAPYPPLPPAAPTAPQAVCLPLPAAPTLPELVANYASPTAATQEQQSPPPLPPLPPAPPLNWPSSCYNFSTPPAPAPYPPLPRAEVVSPASLNVEYAQCYPAADVHDGQGRSVSTPPPPPPPPPPPLPPLPQPTSNESWVPPPPPPQWWQGPSDMPMVLPLQPPAAAPSAGAVAAPPRSMSSAAAGRTLPRDNDNRQYQEQHQQQHQRRFSGDVDGQVGHAPPPPPPPFSQPVPDSGAAESSRTSKTSRDNTTGGRGSSHRSSSSSGSSGRGGSCTGSENGSASTKSSGAKKGGGSARTGRDDAYVIPKKSSASSDPHSRASSDTYTIPKKSRDGSQDRHHGDRHDRQRRPNHHRDRDISPDNKNKPYSTTGGSRRGHAEDDFDRPYSRSGGGGIRGVRWPQEGDGHYTPYNSGGGGGGRDCGKHGGGSHRARDDHAIGGRYGGGGERFQSGGGRGDDRDGYRGRRDGREYGDSPGSDAGRGRHSGGSSRREGGGRSGGRRRGKGGGKSCPPPSAEKRRDARAAVDESSSSSLSAAAAAAALSPEVEGDDELAELACKLTALELDAKKAGVGEEGKGDAAGGAVKAYLSLEEYKEATAAGEMKPYKGTKYLTVDDRYADGWAYNPNTRRWIKVACQEKKDAIEALPALLARLELMENKEKLVAQRSQLLETKVEKITKEKTTGRSAVSLAVKTAPVLVVFDTNWLVHNLVDTKCRVEDIAGRHKDTSILIPKEVLRELDRLKTRGKDEATRSSAQKANRFFRGLVESPLRHGREFSVVRVQEDTELFRDNGHHSRPEKLGADDAILNCCMFFTQGIDTPRKVTLITNDNNFAIRASAHGLTTTGRPQCDPGRCRMPLCPAPPRPSPFSRGY